MSDEYQLRKDIDRVINDVYDLQTNELDVYKKNDIDTKFDNYYDKGEVDEKIGQGGGGDLSDYVKKSDLIDPTKYDIDLDLDFGVRGSDDTIIIDMDIVDYIVNKTINLRSV